MATIEFRDTLVPEAFHGTSEDRAKVIQEEGKFKIFRSPKTYYGDGVYFFENDASKCVKFGKDRCKEDECPRYTIFRALVKLGRCLDLSVEEHELLVKRTQDNFAKFSGKTHKLEDPVIFNFIGNREHLDTIRVFRFAPGKGAKLFEGSRLRSGFEVVLVVRNVDLILNFEVALTGECSL